MARVFLGLGSNIGDGAKIIRGAFSELSSILDGARLSKLWRSRALYVEDQPDFVNAAATGETALSPRSLLAAVNAIEARFGRDRGRERLKGPRTLDIDILLFGTQAISEPDLIIPHPASRSADSLSFRSWIWTEDSSIPRAACRIRA